MAHKDSTEEILPDSDWSKRHDPISFRQMIRVKHHPTKRDTYLSLSAGYPPTPTSRTYGGHVFAQSAWAAAHTVPHGLHIHSMTGYFLLLGDTRYAFEYRVRRVRDGGIYALRVIEAYQNSPAAGNGKSPTFIGICSFKRDERNKHRAGAKGQRKDFSHQELPRDWLQKEYGSVLGKFEDFPLAQGTDGMWLSDMSVAQWKQRGAAFPGVEMRKVDMRGYNPSSVPQGGLEDGGEKARKWRLLMMYKLVQDEKDEDLKGKSAVSDVINEHACAHLYASDRNSLFLAQRALGFEREQGQLGSLSHTVNFHGDAEDLLMGDKVFVQEQWISSSGADRVTHMSRIWGPDGRILASTVQDGMMRMPVGKSREVVDGEALMRREAKL